MNFKIEKAEPKDVPQILQMLHEFAEFENLSEFCTVNEEQLQTAMFDDHQCVDGLMAFDKSNKAIGYALFFENFASFCGQRGLYLEDLYVRSEFRAQGVGLAMLKHLAKLACQRGCERMDWLVLDWNKSAISFYQKFGAEINSSERHCKIVGEKLENLAETEK